MGNKLFSKEWKLSYEAIPSKSTASLVRLFDLFYADDNLTTWKERAQQTSKGCNIGHDIICYNDKLYNISDGTLKDDILRISYTGWEECDLNTYGIDIAIPFYDRRSEPLPIQVDKDDYEKMGITYRSQDTFARLHSVWPAGETSSGETQTKQVTYAPYFLDKNDVIPYSDIYAFSLNSIGSTVCQYVATRSNLGAVGVLKDSNGAMTNVSFSTIRFPTVGCYSSTNKADYDIYLVGEDTAFSKNTLLLERFHAYNYMFLDPDSAYGKEVIYRALFSSYTSGGPTIDKFNLTATFGDSSIKFYINETEKKYFIKALKNTYVWVRAPFFGDYIKPDSFEQELNSISEVKFKDLLLANPEVSIDKYDTSVGVNYNDLENIEFLESDDSQRKTPYKPQVTPLFDSIAISKGLGTLDTTDKKIVYNNVSGSPASVLKNTEQPDFKGFPFSPRINNTTGESSNTTNKTIDDLPKTIPPTIFYDDEYKSKVVYPESARNPVILPKDGNAYIDGRIISPTIDEIIYTIKELTSGRIAEGKEAENLKNIDSRPFNNTDQITVDTVFDEAKYSDFKFFKSSDELAKNEKNSSGSYTLGDPLHITYNDETGYVVDKWINQPKSITYPLYQELRELSARLTKNENTEENYVVKNTAEINKSHNSGGSSLDIEKHNKRAIENLSAWLTNDLDGLKNKDKEYKDTDISNNFNSKNTLQVDSRIGYNDPNFGIIWGPRPAPYSLRELEAFVKGLKYNMLSIFRFLKENFSVTGGLGKSNYSEIKDKNQEYSHYAGSLYQFHKNYNFQAETPNTYFKRNGDLTYGKGAAAKFDDATNFETQHARESSHTLVAEKDGRYSEALYPNESDYGKGSVNGISSNQLEYSSADVYMAADGTWRYLFDNVRVPILKAKY